MRRENEETGSAARNPCPLCGSNRFTWGVISSYGPMQFQSDDAGWLTKVFAGGQKVRARRCDSCRNIQLFADIV